MCTWSPVSPHGLMAEINRASPRFSEPPVPASLDQEFLLFISNTKGGFYASSNTELARLCRPATYR